VEDSNDDEDDDEYDDMQTQFKDKNNRRYNYDSDIERLPNRQYKAVGNSNKESFDNSDDDNNEERKIAALTEPYNEHVNIEIDIPDLICRIDNDDSSGEEDSTTRDTEYHRKKSFTKSNTAGLRGGGDENYEYGDLYFQSSDDENLPEVQEVEEEKEEETDNDIINRSDSTTQTTDRMQTVGALDDKESEAIGGSMEAPKLPGMIRISGCNPNGIKTNQLCSHIQHSLDLNIDIQCYAEVNRNFFRTDIRQSFFEGTKSMDRSSRSTWGTSQLPSNSDYKPGGTAIISTGKTAGRVKQSGADIFGRWTYQLLDGQGDRDILIVSIYQCCKSPTNPTGLTAYRQQEVLLSELDRTDRDPRRNFYRGLTKFVKSYTSREDISVTPILIGDWNEECKGTSSSQKVCDDFGLVNIFDRLYPKHEQFKTYKRGSRCIDFVLAPPELADRVSNFVYEPFLYKLKGDHRAIYFDISERALFGDQKDPAFDPDDRSFSSKDRKATTNYLKAVGKHISANNVVNRIKKTARF
jgi:hypothetical protein